MITTPDNAAIETPSNGEVNAADSSSPQHGQPTHLRSCVLCRQRKVKCDRRQPCANCVRAGANCVHPPGAGRAAKRSRQAGVDGKVMDRLSQLEMTIRHLQQQAKDRGVEFNLPSGSHAQDRTAQVDDADQGPEAAPELGRLIVEESQSRYVSNIMWADLTESIEQLRDMFLDSGSKEEDSPQIEESPPFYDTETPNPSSIGPNAALLGYRSLAHSLRDFHPSLESCMKLFQLFNDNVSPVVRIFHAPTLIRLFWGAAFSPDSIGKQTEALLFAIYYSAVISIDPDQCANSLGESRLVLLERYKFAVEQALARANLLSTHNTLLLQAAVLYVSVLRSDDGTRTVWSLIALCSHIARSMGFHRDGTAFNLPPLETEMRRRIWHHICMLDHRSTEYHGYELGVAAEKTALDTHWPLNVNDSDLSSDMMQPPPESNQATEMTIMHTRLHSSRIIQKVKQAGHLPLDSRLRIMDEHDKWVEQYVEHWDTTQPVLRLAKEICYISTGRVRAFVIYNELILRKRKAEASSPRGNNDNTSKNQGDSGVETDEQALRDQAFICAIDIHQRTLKIMDDSSLDRFAWHSYTYIQWQSLAFVLSEICIRPPSPLCDKAWAYATLVYEKWLSVKFHVRSEQGDDFGQPINKLIAKTKRVRDLQQAERPQQQAPLSQTQMQIPRPGHINEMIVPEQQMQPIPPMTQVSQELAGMNTQLLHSNLNSTPSATIPLGTTRNDTSMYDPGDFDPFLGLMPPELQNEWIQSMTQDDNDPFSQSMPNGPFFEIP
ncbi:fungal-specific transcription factor domain-containing protein [Astrocystis sublimbata]|nr:fungal-specific transcription factor domain-containing protein [Astrocystis sublimbata]